MTVMLWGVTTERVREWARQQKGGTELTGAAASPGVVEGPARVVRSFSEIADVRDGEILVCGSTSPAWAPIFTKIRATVTDVGGVMSHAAIVCREYGLPAVVGTGRATSEIRTGEPIRVDGSAGVVTLLRDRNERRGPSASWPSCAAPTPRRFGGKSAALGELIAAGIPVPGGFALPADCTRRPSLPRARRPERPLRGRSGRDRGRRVPGGGGRRSAGATPIWAATIRRWPCARARLARIAPRRRSPASRRRSCGSAGAMACSMPSGPAGRASSATRRSATAATWAPAPLRPRWG